MAKVEQQQKQQHLGGRCMRMFYCGTNDNKMSKKSSQLSQKLANKINFNTTKTEPCMNHLLEGFCARRATCQFAHVPEEPLGLRHMHDCYKLSLCKHFNTPNGCRFGARCDFLHHELRIQMSPNEYWLVDVETGDFMIELTHICTNNDQRKQRLQEQTVVEVEYDPQGRFLFRGKSLKKPV